MFVMKLIHVTEVKYYELALMKVWVKNPMLQYHQPSFRKKKDKSLLGKDKGALLKVIPTMKFFSHIPF